MSCERDLILAETDDAADTSPNWRWKIPVDVRGVEVPERDEEQLPHSLRIVFDKGGAVCCFACQTSEDLVNLRRGSSPVRRLRFVGGFGADGGSVGILFE